jgi:hypothetical protein
VHRSTVLGGQVKHFDELEPVERAAISSLAKGLPPEDGEDPEADPEQGNQ